MEIELLKNLHESGSVVVLMGFIVYVLREFKYFIKTELEQCEKRYSLVFQELMHLKNQRREID
jgi:hypothetical protein